MEPSVLLINLLLSKNYVKNLSTYNFLERNNYKIEINNYICYCVGIANNKKQIHCFQILGANSNNKLRNLKIKWWNISYLKPQFDYVEFWVYSNLSLKKNFFLYEDRMSLFRSTFIYDEVSESFFRLSSLSSYLHFPEMFEVNDFIFISPDENYFSKNKNICNKQEQKNPIFNEIEKKLTKLIENQIYKNYIKKNHKKLFDELNMFINLK